MLFCVAGKLGKRNYSNHVTSMSSVVIADEAKKADQSAVRKGLAGSGRIVGGRQDQCLSDHVLVRPFRPSQDINSTVKPCVHRLSAYLAIL